MSFDDDQIPTSPSLGRSFMATNGRTKCEVELLPFESVVAPVRVSLTRRDRLTFERRLIVAEMHEALSIAELSATFNLPMLTGQVIVSEMVVEGLLRLQAVAATEVDLRALSDIRSKLASL